MNYESIDSLKSQASQTAYGSGALGTANGAQQLGIQSALKELINEVLEARNVSDNIQSTIGISHPEKEGAVPPSADSLLGIIRDMTYKLRRSNALLAETLQHLNS